MRGSVTAKIGLVLCRVVVPLWVLTGAVFKLVERSPKYLPKETILKLAGGLNFNLDVLLRTLIGLEFLAVGVMLFLPRLSRKMALFMLSVFCLILLGELIRGNFADCGCFGSKSPPPWAILMIDGGLLLGVLAFRPKPAVRQPAARWPLSAAAGWIIAGFALSFLVPAVEAPNQPNDIDRPLPSYYLPNTDEWPGKRWDELDIAGLMANRPKNIDAGRRYVVFYGRTCDHCHSLFEQYFTGTLAVPTTLIAVPEAKQGFEVDGVLPLLVTGHEELELPIGCDWLITTPILVAMEDGVVVCATEGEDPLSPQCLTWGPAAQ